MPHYNREFYGFLGETSSASARAVVPLVQRLLDPTSVLDVGCGTGAWLKVFAAQGITDYEGVDGPWVDAASLQIPVDRFRATDLRKSIDLGRRFDLVVSLEVAEHIPEVYSTTFVESLVRHADAVLFSAAIPGQGGTHHVNEQWPAYWVERFAACGFVGIDCIRAEIWDDSAVEFWYAQNTILFVDSTRLASSPKLTAEVQRCGPRIRSLVHPRLYEMQRTVTGAIAASARRGRDRIRRMDG